MAPKYPASLVDPSFHAPALLQLVSQRPNLNVYLYFAVKTMDVVGRALQSSTSCNTLPRPDQFRLFATKFFTSSSRVGMNVVLTALVLIHRVDERVLRNHIERRIEMQPCHMIFLASLMVAIKSIDEYSGSTRHFLECTSNLITESQLCNYEIDFLKMLDYKVNVSEPELLQYYHDVRSCYASHHPKYVQHSPLMRHEQPHNPPPALPFPSHHHPTAGRSRTISQPVFADRVRTSRSHSEIRPAAKRKPSTHNSGASAYPTPYIYPTKYTEPIGVSAHHSGTRSRAPSVRAPTPYYPSHRLHHDPASSAYPTPSSQRPPVIPLIPVIPPPSPKLRRSKSQATFRGKDGRQEGSLWKKLFSVK